MAKNLKKIKELKKLIRTYEREAEKLSNKAYDFEAKAEKIEDKLFTLETGYKFGDEIEYRGKSYLITGRKRMKEWSEERGEYWLHTTKRPYWLKDYLMGISESPFKSKPTGDTPCESE